LLCSLPQLVAWAFHAHVKVQLVTKLIRVIRVKRLLAYFSERQEDLSADVRWIAGCKFIFVLFATAHWIGCIMFYFAASSRVSSFFVELLLNSVPRRGRLVIHVAHRGTLWLVPPRTQRAGFEEDPYKINWVSGWVEQENVQYDWHSANAIQSYIVRLSLLA
jgi:hypothetical protein